VREREREREKGREKEIRSAIRLSLPKTLCRLQKFHSYLLTIAVYKKSKT
jgi:hypothetical protein